MLGWGQTGGRGRSAEHTNKEMEEDPLEARPSSVSGTQWLGAKHVRAQSSAECFLRVCLRASTASSSEVSMGCAESDCWFEPTVSGEIRSLRCGAAPVGRSLLEPAVVHLAPVSQPTACFASDTSLGVGASSTCPGTVRRRLEGLAWSGLVIVSERFRLLPIWTICLCGEPFESEDCHVDPHARRTGSAPTASPAVTAGGTGAEGARLCAGVGSTTKLWKPSLTSTRGSRCSKR